LPRVSVFDHNFVSANLADPSIESKPSQRTAQQQLVYAKRIKVRARLLGNPKRGNSDYHREMQLQLTQALKRIQPVYSKTKDPELLKLLQDVEVKLK
jgi:hypothetical protein